MHAASSGNLIVRLPGISLGRIQSPTLWVRSMVATRGPGYPIQSALGALALALPLSPFTGWRLPPQSVCLETSLDAG